MKTFGTEYTYPAPLEQVRAMLADPAFRERVAHAQHVVGVEVQVAPPGAAGTPDAPFTLVCRTEQDTSGLPAVARKFVGATTTSVVTERWESADRGTLTIEAPGQPITSTGSVALVPDGEGTRHVVEVQVTVRIPLVGGKLEALVLEALDAGYQIEHETGTAWLEGHR